MEFGLVEKLDASCGMRMRNNNTEPQDNVQGADWGSISRIRVWMGLELGRR